MFVSTAPVAPCEVQDRRVHRARPRSHPRPGMRRQVAVQCSKALHADDPTKHPPLAVDPAGIVRVACGRHPGPDE